MRGKLVRVPPDVVDRLDEYLEALRPFASSRGAVVRMLTALSTPEDLRKLAMRTVTEQTDEIVANAEIRYQRDLPGFVAYANGTLELPDGRLIRAEMEVFPGQGRTEKQARDDLNWNLMRYAREHGAGDDE